MHLLVSADGTINVVYPTLDAQSLAERNATLDAGERIVEWNGDLSLYVEPVWDDNAGTVVEGAAGTKAAAHIEQVRVDLMRQVDEYAGAVFFRTLTTPTDSLELTLYKFVAHLTKAMEANEIINDRDSPAVRHWPSKVRGGTLKKFPMLESESARRGITREQLADSVKALSDYQDDLLATIEEYRPVARDNIENYVLTGDYQADVAAMRAIYDQYVTDLNTALGI